MTVCKYRPRRVSAVRDFPPGCGRFASSASLNHDQGAASLVPLESSVDRDNNGDGVEIANGGSLRFFGGLRYKNGEGVEIGNGVSLNCDGGLSNGDVQIVEVKEEVGAVVLEKENGDALVQTLDAWINFENSELKDLGQDVIDAGGSKDSCKNGDGVQIGSGGLLNSDHGSSVGSMETVKVKAEDGTMVLNRDNGGSLVQNLDGSNNLESPEGKDLVQVVIDVDGLKDLCKNGDDAEICRRRLLNSNCGLRLENMEIVEVKAEEQIVVLDQENGGSLVPDKMDDLNSLENPGGKDLLQGVTDVGGLKDSSNGDVVISNDTVEGTIRRKYPPRRKVSAVRDFPPFCGRNAPLLPGNEKIKTIASVENNGLGAEENHWKEIVETAVNVRENCMQDEQIHESRGAVDETHAELEEFSTSGKKLRNKDEFGDVPEKIINTSMDNIQHQHQLKTEVVPLSSKKSTKIVKEATGKQVATYKVGKTVKKQTSYLSDNMANLEESELWLEKYCGVGDNKHEDKPNSASGIKRNEVEVFERKNKKKKPSLTGKPDQCRDLVVVGELENSLQRSKKSVNPMPAKRSRDLGVSIPPSRPSLNEKGNQTDRIVTREMVRETLRLFQAICRKITQEDEANSSKRSRRIDYLAARVLKENGKYVNTGKQIIGDVPGVEVGDEFTYRVELNIIGLHRQSQGGIDYVKQGRTILATSIVASGGYDDHTDNSDELIYTGSGGNIMGGDKEPKDQKLERGNLALKNSMDAKNPVRVIRGSDSSDTRAGRIYVYDGLYLVEKCWQERGPHAKLVFKFRLVRIPGQQELASKLVMKSKKFKVRDGLCANDISHGKEVIPICAVNTIDDEKPPAFEYVTCMIYPDWCYLTPPEGCNCTSGCTESGKCFCAEKNGEEIPYNRNGAIVEARPIVYECGPLCKCPQSCHNRVTQHGIKFQLEIFKTEKRGWGVRSLNSIPSGSFICEYAGELLEDKEAEQRTGNDDYLFDIGNNFNDNSLWNEVSKLMPEQQSTSIEAVADSSFTIDAARFGNVGRFINHSCSPNLYAQNVLYDHDDKRMPHVMFFAVDNIPPLQELTYHYNYMIDHVFDSAGNIKKKSCHCGSSECTGRMY